MPNKSEETLQNHEVELQGEQQEQDALQVWETPLSDRRFSGVLKNVMLFL